MRESSLKSQQNAAALVEEMLRDLEDEQPASATSLVRKALRLASLCRKAEYRLLFELHLSGFEQPRLSPIDMSSWNSDDSRLKWNPGLAFAEDRKINDENIQALSVERIESSLVSV